MPDAVEILQIEIDHQMKQFEELKSKKVQAIIKRKYVWKVSIT